MTFRLPLKILCTILKYNHVTPKTIQIGKGLSNYTHNVTQLKCLSKKYPFQNRFITYNEANRKKSRKLYKCDEKKCKEMKLAFRNTSKEDCLKCCDGILLPTKSPKLKRLKAAYDASKLKWNHICVDEFCADSKRMDDICGYKIEKKSLPKIKINECEPCNPFVPTKAPKLEPIKWTYDASKLKQERNCYVPECNVDPPRMDDICGYKVTPKKLPEIKGFDECLPCIIDTPTKAPKLVRLKASYDPSKMEQIRNCYKPKCDEDPPRMDNVVGLKVTEKKLPTLLKNECIPCHSYIPKVSPKLKPLVPKYDASKLQWNHPVCKEFCEDAKRMDDIKGYKVVQKILPKLEISKCEPCLPFAPTKAPELKRPKKNYDDSKLKWKHVCPELICEKGPERMDDVMGIKIVKKKLPSLKSSEECVQCEIFTPTKAPKLKPIQWYYDASKLEQSRDCYVPKCNVDPPRMDDICGYKVTSKKLPEIKGFDECLPCISDTPTKAPKLVRPKASYDPSKMEQVRNCYIPKCDEDPPRMDNVVGLKVTEKKLPKLLKNECIPCHPIVPKVSPKLKPLVPKYDASKLQWNHPICKEFCEDAKRMDDIKGYKVTRKKLPKLLQNDCVPCMPFTPTIAPKLNRPKRKYDPYILDRTCVPPEDMCDLDPPRMDDVRCWKPKRKILPSFTSRDRPRFYSTCTNTNRKLSFPIYSSNTYSKLCPKVQGHQRNYSKKTKEPKCKVPKPKACGPRCQKFKLKECKPVARKVCEDYWEKPCKKTDAPYCAYSECPQTSLYEDEHSECENTYQVRLQPQKQVSHGFYKLKQVFPAWAHVDPSLDRKCLSEEKQEPCSLDERDKWTNPCPGMSVPPCKKRARRHCNDQPIHKKCNKREAPYKSFSERCPQFPEVEFTECNANQRCYQKGMVLNGFPCYKDYMVHYTASGKEEIKKPDCLDKPTMPKNKCKSAKPDVVEPKQKRVQCGGEECKKKKPMPECKKPKSKGCKPEPKSKCSDKTLCIIEPVTDPPDNSKKCLKCSGKVDKKMLCVCKPIKDFKSCSSKPAISCKPKKVSCKVNPAKAKCLPKCVFSKTKSICSGYKVSDKNLEQTCTPQPPQLPTSALYCYPIKQEIPAAYTMWEKICAYFRARPGCPTAAEFKQKELEEEARRAAARAGLEIASSRIKLITIESDTSEGDIVKKKRNPKCQMAPKICPKPKDCSTMLTPLKKTQCGSQNQQKLSLLEMLREKCKKVACKKVESCPPKKNTKCQIPKPVCGCKKQCNCKKKTSCKKYSTYSCARRKPAKLLCFKRKSIYSYLSTIPNKTYFSTTTINYSKRNKGKDKITYKYKNLKPYMTEYNKEYINKNSENYLTLNDKYIGKMHMIKLSKIGLKNALIKANFQNLDDVPFTICHSCRVLPKHKLIK